MFSLVTLVSISIDWIKYIYVTDRDIQQAVSEVQSELSEIPIYHFGETDNPNFIPLDPLVQGSSDENLSGDVRKEIKMRDNCFYIYTSGTTGNGSCLLLKTWPCVGENEEVGRGACSPGVSVRVNSFAIL